MLERVLKVDCCRECCDAGMQGRLSVAYALAIARTTKGEASGGMQVGLQCKRGKAQGDVRCRSTRSKRAQLLAMRLESSERNEGQGVAESQAAKLIVAGEQNEAESS